MKFPSSMLLLLSSAVFPGQLLAQELYNPVPGALAVNAALENEKKDALKQKRQTAGAVELRKAIRERDFACRLQAVERHGRETDGRKLAMAGCDARRDGELRAAGLR